MLMRFFGMQVRINVRNITNKMKKKTKESPNVHLEHIEDEIFNFGIDGGRASINFIRSLRDMLMSGSKRSVNVTVKWDGTSCNILW